MAHDNTGHIYADSTSGVRVFDDIVAVVGGLDSIDGKYKPFTLGNINKWAKNKPFRADILGRAATALDRKNANYGLNFNVSVGEVGNDVVSAVKTAAQDTNCFAYDTSAAHAQGKPRGGQNREWHRVQDFNGYYHNAPAPIQPLESTDINRFVWTGNIIQLELYTTDPELSAYQLSMVDVIEGVRASTGIDISGWYIIVAIEYSDTQRFYGLSQKQLGDVDEGQSRFIITLDKALLVDGSPRFYIAAIDHNDVRSTSRVVGLPFLQVGDGYGFGTLHVSTIIPFQFDWQRVYSANAMPTQTWNAMNTEQYRARTYQYHDGSGDIHLQLNSNCDMCYGFVVKNISNGGATLRLSQVTFQSGLSVGVNGWPSEGPDDLATGKIAPSAAWYATSPDGAWTQFPLDGVSMLSQASIYVFFALDKFQRMYLGAERNAIRGRSTKGAELQVFIDNKSVGSIVHEESSLWVRDGVINIEY